MQINSTQTNQNGQLGKNIYIHIQILHTCFKAHNNNCITISTIFCINRNLIFIMHLFVAPLIKIDKQNTKHFPNGQETHKIYSMLIIIF